MLCLQLFQRNRSRLPETEQLQVEFPGIFPDCVVTRSQARRAAQDDADSVDVEENSGVWLAETFF